MNYPQLVGQSLNRGGVMEVPPLGQVGSPYSLDDWGLTQIDRMAIANGGYVRNPTAGTLPRLVGYPDSDNLFWSGTMMR